MMSVMKMRHVARVKTGTRRTALTLAVVPAILLGCGLLTGCGGGGNKVNNPSPGTSATTSRVSGSITDIDGSPVVGATVKVNGQTATSSQGGTYSVPIVTVPANQASLVTTVTVTATVQGKAFSGQNTVEVLNGEANTANVNIVVSDNSNQGSIRGTVRDAGNQALPNARVFIAPGPVTQSNGGQAFTNFSSFTVYTDSGGNYTVPKLPRGVTYTALASYPGHLNQSVPNLTLSSSDMGSVNFNLSASNTSNLLPPVANFGAFSFTFPASPTRSVNGKSGQGIMDAIKAYVLAKRGFKQNRFANANKVWKRNTATRATPAGSLIETDLVWDFEELNNLYGYSIVRATGSSSNFQDIATLRDPLADRYDDLDPVLTPGTSYFYNVGRLDTINFPNNNNSSNSNPADVTIQVSPLNAIQVQSPSPNASTNNHPTFTWNGVSNAGDYQVIVYDTFPDLQTSNGGVTPYWPQDSANPGNSLVSASTTQTTYDGPTLQSGHTYYVVVLAQYAPANNDPTVGVSISVSPIQAFTVQ